MSRAPAFFVAVLLVGSIHLAYAPRGSTVEPGLVEVGFGRLAPGSTQGVNATNATTSIVGSLLSPTEHVLYLNNSNATGAWYARMTLYDSSGVTNLVGLDLGLDNGTSQVSQILASAGNVTQTEGTYVRLEPGSVNTVYVTNTVASLDLASTLRIDVRVSDDAGGASYYVMKLRLDVT